MMSTLSNSKGAYRCPHLVFFWSPGCKLSFYTPGVRLLSALRSEGGSNLVELSLVLPILVLLLLGVADLGIAYFQAIEVSRAAHSAALYGSRNPTDTAGIIAAAVADAPDLPSFTTSSVTASHGCECSDGSSPVINCFVAPICSTNVVAYVQVNTSVVLRASFPYAGIPPSITLHGSARMRAGR